MASSDEILETFTNNITQSKNEFERANANRNFALTMYQESLCDKQKMSASYADDWFNQYGILVSKQNEFSINNYSETVKHALLAVKHRAGILCLKGQLDSLHIPDKLICSGKHESCKFDEVTDNDLRMLKPKIGNQEGSFHRYLKSPLAEPSVKENCTKSVEPQNINSFRTAKEVLQIQQSKKFKRSDDHTSSQGAIKKSLGGRRTVSNKFVPPLRKNETEQIDVPMDEDVDERLANIDPKMVELISNEIMHKYDPISWDDVAGLEYAKSSIQESVVWPLLRPDIFTGLRKPPRGILLFGPPGTGKTLIGKCIASQSKSTFFSISASSLTSKWIGDGEKMVRALFAVAAVHQPSVVFIDEIDSLLCQRSETEHESSRRIKTEFLVQLDGAATSEDERILIVGATNRPQELDEAARRRLIKRLYIPLPDLNARIHIVKTLLKIVKHDLNEAEIDEIGRLTDQYSGADMKTLCIDASMEPIRSIPPHQMEYFKENEVRQISFQDFEQALKRVRPSVSQSDLDKYVQWNKTYGSGA